MQSQKAFDIELNYHDLCLALLHAEDEGDVIEILDNNGFSLENENVWHPLGGNQGNFTTINGQQEEPSAALVEKIINSIDAVLLSECHKNKIDPTSDEAPDTMHEAVEKFLDVREGRLDKLSAAKQTELAERIHLVATGEKKSPCYLVVDNGEGQTPNNFVNTFLSTTKSSPKVKIPFVQGKFNAGGTGSLLFCGKHNIQLIVSKRQPHCPTNNDQSFEYWGFTIIRRRRPTGSRGGNSVFEYLAPDNVIPRFKADSINVLPGSFKRGEPRPTYAEPLQYGTCLKLYNYDWNKKSLATLEARRALESQLQEPCLPFRIDESRPDYIKPNYLSTTVSGIWNQIYSYDPDADKPYIEPDFPAFLSINMPGIGELPIRLVVWHEENIDLTNVPTGLYFLVNGQVHHSDKMDFISRSLKFDYIKHHLLIAVDCSHMNRSVSEDLFMSSRTRIRENTSYREIKSALAEELKQHPGLKLTNATFKKRRKDRAIESKEDIESIFSSIVSKEPSLAAVLNIGGNIQSNVISGSTAQYEGKQFPTYFRIAKEPKEGLVKQCPINRSVRVEIETDTTNDYFERPDNPGELSVLPSPNLIQSSRLWNGIFSISFIPPWDAKVGDVYDIEISVEDINTVAQGPFTCSFKLIVGKKASRTKSPPGNRNEPNKRTRNNGRNTKPLLSAPDPIEVTKDKWAIHGFNNGKEAIKILADDSGYDFYVNVDNDYLVKEMENPKEDPLDLKYWFKWGLTIAALGLIVDEKDKLISQGSPEDEAEPDLERIALACDGLSRVIIPMLRSLHDRATLD